MRSPDQLQADHDKVIALRDAECSSEYSSVVSPMRRKMEAGAWKSDSSGTDPARQFFDGLEDQRRKLFSAYTDVITALEYARSSLIYLTQDNSEGPPR